MADFDLVIDTLYVGSVWAGMQPERLTEAGIGSVLKLTAGDLSELDSLNVLDLSFPDAQSIPLGYLRRGVDFIAAEQAAGRGVLVMCAAGISRSPTFVLAYLVEKKGYDLREAFRLLRVARSIAAPHPALWLSLLAFLNTPYSWADVQSWLTGDLRPY
jgi:atypical dual specificity phosphatase